MRILCHESIGRRGRPVIDGHPKAMVGHVQHEILTHDRQSNQSDVGSRGLAFAHTKPPELSRRGREQQSGRAEEQGIGEVHLLMPGES
jgi:hypothetical protein